MEPTHAIVLEQQRAVQVHEIRENGVRDNSCQGGFTHIIAGSTEILYLVFRGGLSASDYIVRFALPTLAGNIVGGSVIFGLISHAQVRSDQD